MRTFIRGSGLTVAVLWLMVGAAETAQAALVVFNFEEQAATSPPPSGALDTLTLTQSGLTLVLTRPGSRFDIIDTALNPGMPASFGTRSLDPFFANTVVAPFIGNFSATVDSVSIDMGDFGQDVDVVIVEVFSDFNAMGSLLASITASLSSTGNAFTIATLSLSAPGINSIRFIGGSTSFPSSVFHDNITVNTQASPSVVPEPSTLAMGGTGVLLCLGCAWRRRRAA